MAGVRMTQLKMSVGHLVQRLMTVSAVSDRPGSTNLWLAVVLCLCGLAIVAPGPLIELVRDVHRYVGLIVLPLGYYAWQALGTFQRVLEVAGQMMPLAELHAEVARLLSRYGGYPSEVSNCLARNRAMLLAEAQDVMRSYTLPAALRHCVKLEQLHYQRLQDEVEGLLEWSKQLLNWGVMGTYFAIVMISGTISQDLLSQAILTTFIGYGLNTVLEHVGYHWLMKR